MSSLDSRFTFSRTSTATYINSQGLVQYADHNLAVNSTWTDSNTVPSAWSIFNTAGTPTPAVVTIPETGKRSITVSSGVQSFLYQAQTVSPGLPYTLSLVVHSVTGTGPTVGNLIAFNASGAAPGNAAILYYKDGVSVGAGGANTTVTPGTWSAVFSGGNQIRLLQGSGPADSTYTIVVSAPQLQQGVALLPVYVPNTSTSVGYYAPRFDYDPTTLTPRGLLLEGSATNRALRSDDVNTTVTDGTQWAASGYTAGTLSTTLPDGTTGNARRISIASGSGSFRSQAITVSANTAYTWSFWARNNGGSQARYRVWNVTASSSIVDYTLPGSNYVSSIGGANNTSSTWVRVSVTFTTPTGCTGVYVYPCSSDSGSVDLLVWGAQLETGSGASSYIPTGTSQGQRASEVLYMDGTNFSAWWPSGQSEYSVYFAGDITRTPATTQFMWLARTGSGGTGTSLARHFVTTANSIRANNTINDLNSGLTATVGTRFRSAFAVKSGDSALYVNNGSTTASVTASDTGLATTAAQIVFNPNNDVFQHIASLTFWPMRLPNATLQSLIT